MHHFYSFKKKNVAVGKGWLIFQVFQGNLFFFLSLKEKRKKLEKKEGRFRGHMTYNDARGWREEKTSSGGFLNTNGTISPVHSTKTRPSLLKTHAVPSLRCVWPIIIQFGNPAAKEEKRFSYKNKMKIEQEQNVLVYLIFHSLRSRKMWVMGCWKKRFQKEKKEGVVSHPIELR